MRATLLSLLTLAAASGMTGCIVAGYTTGGGPFLWPGGLGVVLVLLLVFFLLRRRR